MQTLIHLFAYDRWANQISLQSLQAMHDPPKRAVDLMAHIIAAQELWLERMQSKPQSLPVWPDWRLDESAAQLPRVWQEWNAFLREADLMRVFQYTNSKGADFRNTVGDASMHVVLHGGYHRGQIALLVRQNGGEPAYTDYAHAVRTGQLS